MLSGVGGFTQHLNKLGKIEEEIIPTLKPYRIDYNTHKIYYDSLIFQGNTWYPFPDGFLTTLELANSEKDKIYCYTSGGKLKATILSERVINLKVSPKGNYIAWYNGEKIIKINMNTFAVDTIQGSFVFSFIQNEQFIAYHPVEKRITFDGKKIASEEFPVQFLTFGPKILVCTRDHLFELKSSGLVPRYTFDGVFFDLKIIDDHLFFVEKREKRRKTEFRLYKTNDLNQVLLVDMLTMEDD
jgi:hypothetical protein